MYLIKENKENIKLLPGYTILTGDIETDKLNNYLIIEKKKNFNYLNKRLNNYVNSGKIKPEIYNIIKANQNERKQLYLLNDNYQINKSEIIKVIEKYRLIGVNLEGTAPQILNDLQNLGYLIIIKN